MKLKVCDAEDMAVASACLQDAVTRLGHIFWAPKKGSFSFVASRFCWEGCMGEGGKDLEVYERVLSAVKFMWVRRARSRGIAHVGGGGGVLQLLAARFEEKEPPGGEVWLDFAGGGAAVLEVEALEGYVRDLGETWRVESRPRHGGD